MAHPLQSGAHAKRVGKALSAHAKKEIAKAYASSLRSSAHIPTAEALEKASVAAHMEASLKAGQYAPAKKKSKKKGKKGPGRPKGSKNKKKTTAKKTTHRKPGRPKGSKNKTHKTHHAKKTTHRKPGRPKGSKNKKSHARKAPHGYSKKKAIARTRASLEYNAAKLNYLVTGRGKETYAKMGKRLHRFRSPKKICHYKTR